MKSDHVIAFIRAAYAGDRDQMDKTIRMLVAEERRGNRERVADRLQQAAHNPLRRNPRTMTPLPEAAREQLIQCHRDETLDDLVLSKATRRISEQIIREHEKADRLAESKLKPSQRILLVGPPGNGKTSLAGAFANALQRPLLVLNYGRLIGSLLGETGARLVKILRGLENIPCVLLMDEFDTIGRSRRAADGSGNSGGEMARVTNVLLTELEAMPPAVLWVGATNYAEALDEALWRRFDHILWVEPPSQKALMIWAERYLAGTGIEAAEFVREWATRVSGDQWSFGLARAAADQVLRHAAVSEERDWHSALELWLRHREKAMMAALTESSKG